MLHRTFAAIASAMVRATANCFPHERASGPRPKRPLSHAIWLLALAVGLAIGAQPAWAQAQSSGDLALVCPQGGATEPQFQNPKTGATFPIVDPQLRAIAAKACNPNLETAESINVSVTNSGSSAIYVAFTLESGNPGPITWASQCAYSNSQATIAPGQTCQAAVPNNAGSTRFCAYTTLQSPSKVNCFLAQSINQTMVETNFGSNGNCYPSMSSCVWYDISVIPSACTDQDWAANECANTGGASYNLPVALACSGGPTYVCRGPKNSQYGSALYPSNCGNPNASCVPTSSTLAPTCDNAYFHPTPNPSPNAECQAGQTLMINFLSGS